MRPLSHFLSARFVKFAAVGVSGVVVNLGALSLLLWFGVVATVASALAIEISILSNFAVNDVWTFRDRRTARGPLARLLRFQVVSLVGAAMQWTVFVYTNVLILWLFLGSSAFDAWWQLADPGALRWLLHPIQSPPAIGGWLYVSQLCGIVVATAWNFLANVLWTWQSDPEVA